MMEAPVAVVSKLVRNSRHEDSAPDQPKGAEDTSSCLGLCLGDLGGAYKELIKYKIIFGFWEVIYGKTKD